MPGMAHAVEHVRDQRSQVLLLLDRHLLTRYLSSFSLWAPRSTP
jgi:hypothetical protein